MKTIKKTAIFTMVLLMSASIGLAGPKGNEKDKGRSDGNRVSEKNARVSVNIFVAGDHDMIRNHFLVHRGGLPPGLAKRGGDLPPGLEKQLRRNGHLPPGLEKKLHPFPIELEGRLPPLKQGLIRGMIGVSAVIVDKRTSVILDVFKVF